MKITDFSEDERPREKLMSQGPAHLSDAELLAILMHTGTPRHNVIDMARALMREADFSLTTLSEMSLERMCSVDGIGIAKAATISSAVELGRRLAVQLSLDRKKQICCSADAAAILTGLFTTDVREECWCLFVKRNRRLLGSLRISEGGETLTEINIRKIVRKALDLGASAVILSHNHPSGNPRPSTADIKQTEKLRKALQTFELSLMDHIILSENGWYSFSDEASG